MPYHYQSAQDFFLLGSQVDGQEGVVRGMQGDAVDQTTALEEGTLTVNTAAIVFAALAHVDDPTFCCASELWFEAGELPFEVFYYRHPGGVLYNVSICGWPPCGPESPALHVD
jgi:hypothetical protein